MELPQASPFPLATFAADKNAVDTKTWLLKNRLQIFIKAK